MSAQIASAYDHLSGRARRELSHVPKVFLIDRDGDVREIYSALFLYPVLSRELRLNLQPLVSSSILDVPLLLVEQTLRRLVEDPAFFESKFSQVASAGGEKDHGTDQIRRILIALEGAAFPAVGKLFGGFLRALRLNPWG